MTSRNSTSAPGSVTASTAVLVPPMSMPTDTRPRSVRLMRGPPLLLPPGTSVVVDQGSGGVEGVSEVQGAELAGDRGGTAVACRGLDGGSQDIDDVNVMLEVGGGRASRGQCQHRLAKAVGPVPGSIRTVVAAPMAPVSPQYLDAGGIPVVPEQVGGSLGPVQLDRGPAVRPDRVAGHDRGQGAAAVPHDEVADIRVNVGQCRAAELADDTRGVLQHARFGHGAQQRGERLDVVDGKVTEGTDLAGVVPRRPGGTCVAIHGPGRVDLPGDARGNQGPQEAHGR